jgi:hypothetical protein
MEIKRRDTSAKLSLKRAKEHRKNETLNRHRKKRNFT